MLKPVLAFAFVDEVITPPTKSASNTIAAFGGEREGVRDGVVEAVLQGSARAAVDVRVSPRIFAIVLRAVVTDGSVHLILCAVSWSYFAGPNVRR